MAWVVALTVLGRVGEARAQGSGYPSGVFDGLVYTCLAIDGSFALAGIITGVGSSMKLANGVVSKPWFVASGVFGIIHLGLGVGSLGLASETGYGRHLLNPVLAGIAAGHFAIGLWNVLVPLVGLMRPSASGPTVAPMVFNGRGAAGRRWGGLGVQVSGF